MSWLYLGFYYIILLSRIGLSYQLYMLCELMLQQGSQKIWSMEIQRIQIPHDLFNILPSGKYSFVEHDDSSCVHDKSEDMILFFTDMNRRHDPLFHRHETWSDIIIGFTPAPTPQKNVALFKERRKSEIFERLCLRLKGNMFRSVEKTPKTTWWTEKSVKIKGDHRRSVCSNNTQNISCWTMTDTLVLTSQEKIHILFCGCVMSQMYLTSCHKTY